MKVADLFAWLTVKPDMRSFDASERLLHGIKHALYAIAGFEAIHWAHGLVEGATSAAVGFIKLSQKTGVSIEALQQLQYAARLANVDQGSLEVGLRKLATTAYAASKGGGEARDTLRSLGLRATDARGQVRPIEDMLGDLAERFHTMPDGVEKTALAVKVFGRGGAELIPLLNRGRDGIAGMREEFVGLGGQIDGETAEQFEHLHEDQTRLSASWAAIKMQVAVALMPTIKALVHDLLEWVKANRKMIALRLAQVIRGIVFVARLLASAIGLLARAFDFLSKNAGLAVAALGALVAAMLIYEHESILVAAKSALAWIAAMAPFVLMVLAILALIIILDDLYNSFFKGHGVFRDFYMSAKEWIHDKLIPLLEDVHDRFTMIGIKVGTAVVGGGGLGADLEKARKAAKRTEAEDAAKAAGAAGAAQAAGERRAGFTVPQRIAEVQKQIADSLEILAHPTTSGAAIDVADLVKLNTELTIQNRRLQQQAIAPGTALGTVVQTNNVTINTGAHADDVKRVIDDHHDRRNREAAAALGGKRGRK